MSSLGRVPRLIAPLHAYINNTTDYLLASSNWLRLGLLAPELQTWQDFRADWNALYPLYSNKQESRTIAITARVHYLQKLFTEFASRVISRMPGMPTVTPSDAAVFNFVLRRKNPSHTSTPIGEVPMFGISVIGGGFVKFNVHGTHDESRARKLSGTEVEVSYMLLDRGEKPPLHAEDLTQHFISSRASFVLKCGDDTAGKVLVTSLRWIVIKNPSRNGPWSPLARVVVA